MEWNCGKLEFPVVRSVSSRDDTGDVDIGLRHTTSTLPKALISALDRIDSFTQSTQYSVLLMGFSTPYPCRHTVEKRQPGNPIHSRTMEVEPTQRASSLVAWAQTMRPVVL